MLTGNVKFQSFRNNKKKIKIKKIFKDIKKKFDDKNDSLLLSLSSNYKNSFNISDLKKYKKFNSYNLIGMGGSSLGAKAIYSFLNHKIKKKFNFIDNIDTQKPKNFKNKQLNIVISKSGSTPETLSQLGSIVNIANEKNILNSLNENMMVITEFKDSPLFNIAKKITTCF